MIKFPQGAPVPISTINELEVLLSKCDPTQIAWLGGYLSGISREAADSGKCSVSKKVNIIYGTESGNSETLADITYKALKKQGLKPVVKSMADINAAKDIDITSPLLVIVSTWGEGEPPEGAQAFYDALIKRADSLKGLSFSVCALGDTSYEKFCQTGKDIDKKLEKLGAERLLQRVDCDVDFEEPHAEWLESILAKLSVHRDVPPVNTSQDITTSQTAYGKKNPFPAELTEKVLLSAKGSKKETWHFELSLENSGLSYEVGDALGVIPQNSPQDISSILKVIKASGSEQVRPKGCEVDIPLQDALRERLDITALSKSVAKKLQAKVNSKKLGKLLSDEKVEDWKNYMLGRQIIDLLEDYGGKNLGADDLIQVLRPLPPRLYSIASSLKAHPDEVHLTVAAVRYESHGRKRNGVASTYLPDILEQGGKAPIFIQPNKRFRLPENSDAPIIMIGPGTGIAPFRAFVEERAESGAKGKNWLFFGDQHYTYDFLYQLEWQEYLKKGVLTNLDVAFSRDQPEKIYVQDRIKENGKELYRWLNEGAYIYVCGDAVRMAGDVNTALVEVIKKGLGGKQAKAEDYLEDIKSAGRYQKDVY